MYLFIRPQTLLAASPLYMPIYDPETHSQSSGCAVALRRRRRRSMDLGNKLAMPQGQAYVWIKQAGINRFKQDFIEERQNAGCVQCECEEG